jgi:hypothetical protein
MKLARPYPIGAAGGCAQLATLSYLLLLLLLLLAISPVLSSHAATDRFDS